MQKRKFIKVEDIAAELDVTEGTVRTWIREGKLHGGKVGRDWRIPVEEYERFLQEYFYRDTPPDEKHP